MFIGSIMTSFIIDAQKNRSVHSSWKQDPDCPFCRIVRGELPAYRVFENEEVVAILDILPLRRGHTLVIPKIHLSRLSELPSEFAAATGEAVTKVAHAVTQALGNTALNVVGNQEYAQAVHHVHYHIIPAPSPSSTKNNSEEKDPRIPLTSKEMHKLEFESRTELDDKDAEVLVRKICARL